MTSFADLERTGLAETARTMGAYAPTLCAGWNVRDLVVHLIVRERRPWAAPGIMVPALAGVTRWASARLATRPFDRLLELVATPPVLLRSAIVQRAVNSVEFFVHHEDIRRAQPAWTPRQLTRDAEADLWRGLSLLGRMAARRAGVPLVVTDGVRRSVLRRGEDPVVLTAPVSELVLTLTGRQQVREVTWSATPAQQALLEAADFSL